MRHRSTKTLSIQSVCLCVLPKKLGRRGRPIRSSFYVGENFSRYRAGAGGATASSRGTIREQLPHTRNSFDEEVEQSAATEEEIRQQQLGVHESFLMATGSADHVVSTVSCDAHGDVGGASAESPACGTCRTTARGDVSSSSRPEHAGQRTTSLGR